MIYHKIKTTLILIRWNSKVFPVPADYLTASRFIVTSLEFLRESGFSGSLLCDSNRKGNLIYLICKLYNSVSFLHLPGWWNSHCRLYDIYDSIIDSTRDPDSYKSEILEVSIIRFHWILIFNCATHFLCLSWIKIIYWYV